MQLQLPRLERLCFRCQKPHWRIARGFHLTRDDTSIGAPNRAELIAGCGVNYDAPRRHIVTFIQL